MKRKAKLGSITLIKNLHYLNKKEVSAAMPIDYVAVAKQADATITAHGTANSSSGAFSRLLHTLLSRFVSSPVSGTVPVEALPGVAYKMLWNAAVLFIGLLLVLLLYRFLIASHVSSTRPHEQ
jgi:hypothetical protein